MSENTVNLNCKQLLDGFYCGTLMHTHTLTKTEEKGMDLEVEKKQEMGTVGNLCPVDQANASVNRKEDQTPESVGVSVNQPDVLTITL